MKKMSTKLSLIAVLALGLLASACDSLPSSLKVQILDITSVLHTTKLASLKFAVKLDKRGNNCTLSHEKITFPCVVYAEPIGNFRKNYGIRVDAHVMLDMLELASQKSPYKEELLSVLSKQRAELLNEKLFEMPYMTKNYWDETSAYYDHISFSIVKGAYKAQILY